MQTERVGTKDPSPSVDAICDACREDDHEHCEGYRSNGAPCACPEVDCGANA